MATLYQCDKIPLTQVSVTVGTATLLWTSPALTLNQTITIRARLHVEGNAGADAGYAELVCSCACNSSGVLQAVITGPQTMNGANAVNGGVISLTITFATSGNTIQISAANGKPGGTQYYWLTGEFDIWQPL